MRNSKKKAAFIVFLILVLLTIVGFGIYYYISSTANNYTYAEKRWINDNSNSSIEVFVEPSLPVFSDNGSGVFYDFIKALK